MKIYNPPIKEFKFILEAIGYDELSSIEKYAGYDLQTVIELLNEAGKFCVNELLPLNSVGDEKGVTFDPETHEVKLPEEFVALFQKYVENGFGGLSQPEEFGGGGAPHLLGLLIGEMVLATNKSFSMGPGLTKDLILAIRMNGSDEQKETYLPSLISGEVSGTMCLTEPQAGTDLGLVSTKAVPNEDGKTYSLTGTKIWITFGEHNFTDNILHLVLAKLPDAPPGIKGISAFIVPKVLENGERNKIFCGGIEHKLGINASPTCVMNLEGAEGYLMGEPHKGMKTMFVMMNSARLGVGQEGVALTEIAYQTALAFAKDRKQSRSLNPDKVDKSSSADNILVHPDVRRMLLNIKSTNEAMRCLVFYTGKLISISHSHPDESRREDAEDIISLLTPVIKSYLTERGFLNISDAMQVCGGAGYTTEWNIEQYLRDERIAMIYEGTNHIQALDLVGRKLPMHGGRLVQKFQKEIETFLQENAGNPDMGEFLSPIKESFEKLQDVTMWMMKSSMSDSEVIGAVSSNYLNAFALATLSYMWGIQVKHALGQGGEEAKTKLKTARYFNSNVLPEIDSIISIIKKGKSNMMDFGTEEL
ncbi:MAG: acyl-CoA dehydrogenase [Halobacteriovoraceae bacterium]|nr:acyl-CoA dehydrogenase [Halobacteriovoraceae bacterium]